MSRNGPHNPANGSAAPAAASADDSKTGSAAGARNSKTAPSTTATGDSKNIAATAVEKHQLNAIIREGTPADDLLKRFPDLLDSVITNDGNTPLSQAAFFGRLRLVTFFLTLNANTLIPNKAKQTALAIAREENTNNSHQEIINLIQATQLKQSILKRNLAGVREALAILEDNENEKVHALLNAPDPNGDTPLMLALQQLGAEATLVLEEILKIEGFNLLIPNRELKLAWHLAFQRRNDLNQLYIELEKRTFIQALYRDERPLIVEMLQKNRALLHLPLNKSNDTALILASFRGQPGLVKFLLDQPETKPLAKGEGNHTAFHWAKVEFARLEKGDAKQADMKNIIDLLTPIFTKKFQEALRDDKDEDVKLILDDTHTETPEWINKVIAEQHQNPCMLAAQHGATKTLTYLLSRNAKTYNADKKDQPSALGYAVLGRKLDAVRTFFQADSKILASSPMREEPILLNAAHAGLWDIIEYLLIQPHIDNQLIIIDKDSKNAFDHAQVAPNANAANNSATLTKLQIATGDAHKAILINAISIISRQPRNEEWAINVLKKYPHLINAELNGSKATALNVAIKAIPIPKALVKWLLQQPSLNLANLSNVELPLINPFYVEALQTGDLITVQNFLKVSPTYLNSPLTNKTQTPVMIAASHGHFALVEYLVAQPKINLTATDSTEATVLSLASPPDAKVALEAKARVTAGDTKVTPATDAKTTADKTIFSLISNAIKKQFENRLETGSRLQLIVFISRYPHLIDERLSDGNPPLLHAVITKKKKDLIELLIQRKANLLAIGHENMHVLQWLKKHDSTSDLIPLLETALREQLAAAIYKDTDPVKAQNILKAFPELKDADLRYSDPAHTVALPALWFSVAYWAPQMLQYLLPNWTDISAKSSKIKDSPTLFALTKTQSPSDAKVAPILQKHLKGLIKEALELKSYAIIPKVIAEYPEAFNTPIDEKTPPVLVIAAQLEDENFIDNHLSWIDLTAEVYPPKNLTALQWAAAQKQNPFMLKLIRKLTLLTEFQLKEHIEKDNAAQTKKLCTTNPDLINRALNSINSGDNLQSPLLYAVALKKQSVVTSLLTSPLINLFIRNDKKQSALKLASTHFIEAYEPIKQKHGEQLYQQLSTDPADEKSSILTTINTLLTENPELINEPFVMGKPLWRVAIETGRPEVFKHLTAEYKVIINCRLTEAAKTSPRNQEKTVAVAHEHMVGLFKKSILAKDFKTAEIVLDLEPTFYWQTLLDIGSPLVFVVNLGQEYYKFATQLLKKGASIFTPGSNGQCFADMVVANPALVSGPLETSIKTELKELVQWVKPQTPAALRVIAKYYPKLLNETLTTDSSGDTPLIRFTWIGDIEAVKCLISLKVNLTATNHSGESALYHARTLRANREPRTPAVRAELTQILEVALLDQFTESLETLSSAAAVDHLNTHLATPCRPTDENTFDAIIESKRVPLGVKIEIVEEFKKRLVKYSPNIGRHIYETIKAKETILFFRLIASVPEKNSVQLEYIDDKSGDTAIHAVVREHHPHYSNILETLLIRGLKATHRNKIGQAPLDLLLDNLDFPEHPKFLAIFKKFQVVCHHMSSYIAAALQRGRERDRLFAAELERYQSDIHLQQFAIATQKGYLDELKAVQNQRLLNLTTDPKVSSVFLAGNNRNISVTRHLLESGAQAQATDAQALSLTAAKILDAKSHVKRDLQTAATLISSYAAFQTYFDAPIQTLFNLCEIYNERNKKYSFVAGTPSFAARDIIKAIISVVKIRELNQLTVQQKIDLCFVIADFLKVVARETTDNTFNLTQMNAEVRAIFDQRADRILNTELDYCFVNATNWGSQICLFIAFDLFCKQPWQEYKTAQTEYPDKRAAFIRAHALYQKHEEERRSYVNSEAFQTYLKTCEEKPTTLEKPPTPVAVANNDAYINSADFKAYLAKKPSDEKNIHPPRPVAPRTVAAPTAPPNAYDVVLAKAKCKQGEWSNLAGDELLTVVSADVKDETQMKPCFIRVDDDAIYDVREIIEEATKNLQLKKTKKHEIWLGTDRKRTPLSTATLQILGQMAPSLKALITYTEELEAKSQATGNNNYLEVFKQFRAGLKQGSSHAYLIRLEQKKIEYGRHSGTKRFLIYPVEQQLECMADSGGAEQPTTLRITSEFGTHFNSIFKLAVDGKDAKTRSEPHTRLSSDEVDVITAAAQKLGVEAGSGDIGRAGIKAFEAQRKFSEFWCRLDDITQKKIRALRARITAYVDGANQATKDHTIGDVLDIVLDTKPREDNVTLCMGLQGEYLEKLYSDDKVSAELMAMGSGGSTELSQLMVSQNILTRWQEQIIADLTYKPQGVVIKSPFNCREYIAEDKKDEKFNPVLRSQLAWAKMAFNSATSKYSEVAAQLNAMVQANQPLTPAHLYFIANTSTGYYFKNLDVLIRYADELVSILDLNYASTFGADCLLPTVAVAKTTPDLIKALESYLKFYYAKKNYALVIQLIHIISERSNGVLQDSHRDMLRDEDLIKGATAPDIANMAALLIQRALPQLLQLPKEKISLAYIKLLLNSPISRKFSTDEKAHLFLYCLEKHNPKDPDLTNNSIVDEKIILTDFKTNKVVSAKYLLLRILQDQVITKSSSEILKTLDINSALRDSMKAWESSFSTPELSYAHAMLNFQQHYYATENITIDALAKALDIFINGTQALPKGKDYLHTLMQHWFSTSADSTFAKWWVALTRPAYSCNRVALTLLAEPRILAPLKTFDVLTDALDKNITEVKGEFTLQGVSVTNDYISTMFELLSSKPDEKISPTPAGAPADQKHTVDDGASKLAAKHPKAFLNAYRRMMSCAHAARNYPEAAKWFTLVMQVTNSVCDEPTDLAVLCDVSMLTELNRRGILINVLAKNIILNIILNNERFTIRGKEVDDSYLEAMFELPSFPLDAKTGAAAATAPVETQTVSHGMATLATQHPGAFLNAHRRLMMLCHRRANTSLSPAVQSGFRKATAKWFALAVKSNAFACSDATELTVLCDPSMVDELHAAGILIHVLDKNIVLHDKEFTLSKQKVTTDYLITLLKILSPKKVDGKAVISAPTATSIINDAAITALKKNHHPAFLNVYSRLMRYFYTSGNSVETAKWFSLVVKAQNYLCPHASTELAILRTAYMLPLFNLEGILIPLLEKNISTSFGKNFTLNGELVSNQYLEALFAELEKASSDQKADAKTAATDAKTMATVTSSNGLDQLTKLHQDAILTAYRRLTHEYFSTGNYANAAKWFARAIKLQDYGCTAISYSITYSAHDHSPYLPFTAYMHDNKYLCDERMLAHLNDLKILTSIIEKNLDQNSDFTLGGTPVSDSYLRELFTQLEKAPIDQKAEAKTAATPPAAGAIPSAAIVVTTADQKLAQKNKSALLTAYARLAVEYNDRREYEQSAKYFIAYLNLKGPDEKLDEKTIAASAAEAAAPVDHKKSAYTLNQPSEKKLLLILNNIELLRRLKTYLPALLNGHGNLSERTDTTLKFGNSSNTHVSGVSITELWQLMATKAVVGGDYKDQKAAGVEEKWDLKDLTPTAQSAVTKTLNTHIQYDMPKHSGHDGLALWLIRAIEYAEGKCDPILIGKFYEYGVLNAIHLRGKLFAIFNQNATALLAHKPDVSPEYDMVEPDYEKWEFCTGLFSILFSVKDTYQQLDAPAVAALVETLTSTIQHYYKMKNYAVTAQLLSYLIRKEDHQLQNAELLALLDPKVAAQIPTKQLAPVLDRDIDIILAGNELASCLLECLNKVPGLKEDLKAVTQQKLTLHAFEKYNDGAFPFDDKQIQQVFDADLKAKDAQANQIDTLITSASKYYDICNRKSHALKNNFKAVIRATTLQILLAKPYDAGDLVRFIFYLGLFESGIDKPLFKESLEKSLGRTPAMVKMHEHLRQILVDIENQQRVLLETKQDAGDKKNDVAAKVIKLVQNECARKRTELAVERLAAFSVGIEEKNAKLQELLLLLVKIQNLSNATQMAPFLLRVISSTKGATAARLGIYLNLIPAEEQRQKLISMQKLQPNKRTPIMQKICEKLNPLGDLAKLSNAKIHEFWQQYATLLTQIPFKAADQAAGAAAATAAAVAPNGTAAAR